MERMEIEELKDYYKARVEPYGKSMNEILEEFAKETKAYKQLEEENKKLKEENEYRKRIADVVPEGEGHIAEETIQDLQARINELKETIKDHQLYEEKLEHRIIELEELLHGE